MNTPQALETDLTLKTLEDFRARCNESKAVGKLIKRWDRTIEIHVSSNPQASYFLPIDNGTVHAPTLEQNLFPEMTIAGNSETLRQIFCGALNPARAHLDGEIQVYGSQKDQLVLDSIVLLIWGF